MVCGNKGVLEELRFIYLTFKQAKKDMFCLFQIHVFFVVEFGILVIVLNHFTKTETDLSSGATISQVYGRGDFWLAKDNSLTLRQLLIQ